jgi:hypothetical protein
MEVRQMEENKQEKKEKFDEQGRRIIAEHVPIILHGTIEG